MEALMARMERVEAVLADARSDWARQHWSIVLEYFRRQLKQLGQP